MWMYYNPDGMKVTESYLFATEQELNEFIARANADAKEKFPDLSYPWDARDYPACIFEIEPISVDDAMYDWCVSDD